MTRERWPKPADFSDRAKIARGIAPRDLNAEVKSLKGDLVAMEKAHQQTLERFRDRVRDAIKAFDEGRRGDAISALRALARKKDPGPSVQLPCDVEPA